MKEEFKVGDLVTWSRGLFCRGAKLHGSILLVTDVSKSMVCADFSILTLISQSTGKALNEFAEYFDRLEAKSNE